MEALLQIALRRDFAELDTKAAWPDMDKHVATMVRDCKIPSDDSAQCEIIVRLSYYPPSDGPTLRTSIATGLAQSIHSLATQQRLFQTIIGLPLENRVVLTALVSHSLVQEGGAKRECSCIPDCQSINYRPQQLVQRHIMSSRAILPEDSGSKNTERHAGD